MYPNYNQFQDEPRRVSPRFRSNKVEFPNLSPQHKDPPSSQYSHNTSSQPSYYQPSFQPSSQPPPPPFIPSPTREEGIKRHQKQPSIDKDHHGHHEEEYSGIGIPADWNLAEEHAVTKKTNQ